MNSLHHPFSDESLMKMRHLLAFHDRMKEQNLFLVYEGDFTPEVTKSLLAIAERVLEAEQIDEAAMRKIYYVMIESLRNICKYQLQGGALTDELQAVFMLGMEPDGFTVISGNPVTHIRMEKLREKLDYINGLDMGSIHALYQNARQAGTDSTGVESGLGFIDMAKRTGKKLHYQFEEINEDYAYFTFMVTVPHIPSDSSSRAK